MKKLLTLIIVAVALQSCSLTNLIPSYDYPSAEITINIDLQPAWGPIGYDYAAYYYMPEINIYYDINRSLFYYQSNNRWIGVKYLPPSYRVYDLFKIYKVVINYNNPWEYNRNHRAQYKHYRDDRTQTTIRMSNDKRYSKSWDNLRPWVDPNRRSNSKTDYKNQNNKPSQPSANKKPTDNNRPNGYRTDEYNHNNQAPVAGGSYRQKDGVPSRGQNSSASQRNPQAPQKPATTTKAPSDDKKPSSSSNGSGSRGNSRPATSNDKPQSTRSSSSSGQDVSPSNATTTTRGR